MTELELYKFVTDKAQQISWHEETLILWLYLYDLAEFAELIKPEAEDELMINLQRDCVAIELNEICEDYGILPENICSREKVNG